MVGMKGVVEHYKKWNGDSDFGVWSIDQVEGGRVNLMVTPRSSCPLSSSGRIANSATCPLAMGSGRGQSVGGLVTSRLQLKPRRLEDQGICYHGNLMNCFM